MDTICLFGIPVFGLFEFKISDIWQQLVYRTKLRTTGLMALLLVGKSLIIHENRDDFTTQPAGESEGKLPVG